MSKQIFKKEVPIDDFYEFIKKICKKEPNTNKFILDINAYKKGIYEKTIEDFILYVKDYYHTYKRIKYIEERELNFNNFLTIIRHIIKYYNIEYEIKMIYDRSRYSIIYFIEDKPVLH